MPIPLLVPILASIAAPLAERGLKLLSGIFKGATDKAAHAVEQLVKDKTGIEIYDEQTQSMAPLSDEQWVQLRQFEQEYQIELLRISELEAQHTVELEKARYGDIAGARSMAVSTTQSEDPFVRRFVYILAIILVVSSFTFVFYAAFGHDYAKSGQEGTRVIDTITGFILASSLGAIIQFFFGSSQGSVNKQRRLDEVSDRAVSLAERRGTGNGR